MKTRIKLIAIVFTACYYLTSTNMLAQSLIFSDDFNSNEHQWEMRDESQSVSIQNSQLVCINKSSEPLLFEKKFEFHSDQPFEIEFGLSEIKKGSSAFLLFGFVDGDYFKAFHFDNITVMPRYFMKNKWADAGVYGKSVSQTPKKLKAVLEVTDNGNFKSQKIHYYVNDQLIGTDISPNILASANSIVFQIEPNSEVSFDYIRIKGNAIEKEKKAQFVINSSKINPTHPLPTGLNNIKAGSPIYGMIQTDKPISQITGPYGVKFTERIYAGENVLSEYSWDCSYNDIKDMNQYYEISISPDLNKIEYPTQGYVLSKGLAELSKGKHKIKIKVLYQINGSREMNLLGETELGFDNADEASYNAYKKMVSIYQSASLKNVKLPTAGMKNTTLENEIQKAVEKAWKNQQVMKIIIMDTDWQYMYHSVWETVTDRYLNVAVVVKDQNGSCIIFYPVALQGKIDSGYETQFRLGGNHAIEKYIDCANIK
ncbi:MAG: hypothetical protein IAE67_02565 [Candidatus Competibacteraceae bacterium]|nr:hypothetical protein [Candidatus Competibacteraceae bacterium]